MAKRAWELAPSLITLRGQLRVIAPNRSTVSDGAIGDADHLAAGWTDSDHNPWWPTTGTVGLVRAVDITHDPSGGMDCHSLSAAVIQGRDSRALYLIWNGRIADRRPITHGGVTYPPWTWLPYSGTSKHDHHLHLSVVASAACQSPALWSLPGLATAARRTLGEDTEMRVETEKPELGTPKKDWPRQWISFGFDPPKGWGGAGVVKLTFSAPGGWIGDVKWWRRRDASTPVGVPNQPHDPVSITLPGGAEQFQGRQVELSIPERCDELELSVAAPGGLHFSVYYER
jgi:hypothetical protein